MNRTPLALALVALLFSVSVNAREDDDCPSDAQMIASMSMAELRQYEAALENPELPFDEVCKDASDQDEADAAGSRLHYCVKRTAPYSSHNPDTGQTETATVTLYDYVSLPRNGQTWMHRVRVVFDAVQGNAMSGLVVTPELYCGSCTDKQPFAPLTLSGPGTYDFAVPLGFNTDEGKTGQDTQLVLSRFNNDQSLIQSSAPTLRCDKVARSSTSGCRFADYPAVFEVSLSDPDTDESAEHIKVAQSTLPGTIGRWHENPDARGVPLRRLRNKRVAGENRNVSGALCRARFPDGAATGLNCDEYPFAATHEGASLVPETSMSVRYILGEDNKKVGGKLGAFYCTHARLLDGEEFWVKVVD
ncbi:NucA/NucB deoxyribonuclease domain-containing protein [Stenotrophomonas sp. NPDC077421]|uniref:NucA/NucB deoxyribonuclease domain-containing protein n=1 Tax=Stenotrophomonas sp. NPDC077421 TaxID=3414699 RepID=UPI003C2C33A5